MTVSVTHPFVTADVDGADATLVRPSNWNASHSFNGTPNAVLAFDGSGNAKDDIGFTYANGAAAITSIANPSAPTLNLVGATALTTNQPVLNMSQTWNAGAVIFTGINLTVTNTASAAGSRLLSLGTGSGAQLTVGPNGFVYWPTLLGTVGLVPVIESGLGSAQALGFGNNAANIAFDQNGLSVPAGSSVNFLSGSIAAATARDTILIRGGAAATLQLGNTDAAAPVAQTLQVQSVVAGTTDTAGANWTFIGSKGTGLGAGGSIIFKTAPAGTTGTSQNAAANALLISSTGNIQFGPASSTAALATNQAGGALDIRLGGFAGTLAFEIGQSNINAQTGGSDIGTASVPWRSLFLGASNNPAIQTAPASATLQQGAADAAAPVAQKLQVQSVVAGTSNTAGAAWTFIGSKGTGTGAGGSIIFQTAPAGSTGTSQNSPATALTLNSSQQVIVGNATANGPQLCLGGTAAGISNGSAGDVAVWNNHGWVASLGNGGSWGTGILVPSNSAAYIGFASGTTYGVGFDTIWSRAAAATFQQGAADAAAPVAQTLQAQSVVAGTSNTAGATWTFNGSKGTGTGAGGNIVFAVAQAGSTGTSQNSATTALTINASQSGCTIVTGLQSSNSIYFGFGTGGSNSGHPTIGSQVNLGWSSTTSSGGAADMFMSRAAAATLQHGAADAAAPAAQTLQVQSVVAGTSNTAGADWTLQGSRGTGTGAGGNIVFKTAPAGITGTSQNAATAMFTVRADQTIQLNKAFTVATLPAAGVVGRMAYVTDALTPSYNATVVGGGAIVIPVFDNGANWICH